MTAPRGPVRVVMFCGGSGAATIAREFLRTPGVHLTLLVNAFDDGLSTGAIRRHVAGLLGPSDFRKNIAQLLELSSAGQYAVQELLRLRLPEGTDRAAFDALVRSLDGGTPAARVPALVRDAAVLLARLDDAVRLPLREDLAAFAAHLDATSEPFDFSDCALGNVVFAGAFLRRGRDFNRTVRQLAQTLRCAADVVNVTGGEHRALVALKDDGTLLPDEASIVGPQGPSPIRRLFLLAEPLSGADRAHLAGLGPAERERWLAARHRDATLSVDARDALAQASVVIYGPGTPHSSLLPSYLTPGLSDAVAQSPARWRVFVGNLRRDHDVATLDAPELLALTQRALGDADGTRGLVTHVLADPEAEPRVPHPLPAGTPVWIVEEFHSPADAGVHSGARVVSRILRLIREEDPDANGDLLLYVDLYERSLALENLVQEFVETSWKQDFRSVTLTLNHVTPSARKLPPGCAVETVHHGGDFSEIGAFRAWLAHGTSQYFASVTGDGEYRLRDVPLAVRVLRERGCASVQGARNQSRRVFLGSLRDAYTRSRFLFGVSLLGGYGISALCSARFGVVFADPLTGFRLVDRTAIPEHVRRALLSPELSTTLDLMSVLLDHGLEIVEMPVAYRFYPGFTRMDWRLRRGFENARSLLP